ncbi:hypothetical protein EV652_121110 [Kribbella steppae]|uniref:Uncharacterized protein n=1 Tax=Kribbella steppae TaxID=2512223 RepID=A0A4R2GXJ3_9ACTN|nr:hypothetical protein EV652_121110 [Kribbella steppae]
MENWIDLTIECRPNGSLTVSGEVVDRLGVGNRLAFELHDLDQTYLPAWLSQLTEIEGVFPIVGRP